MPRGRLPTSTVSVTSSVSPFTTEMELPFSLETKIVIASAGSARGAAQAKAARPALIPFRIGVVLPLVLVVGRSEEHTSELQSLMRISYAVFCLKKKKKKKTKLA